MKLSIRVTWNLAALAFVLAGCGKSAEPAAAPTGQPPEEGIKRRLAEDLPAVSAYLPPLDDGRVEIAGPEGWIQLPSTSKWLVAFAPDKARAYPRIQVAAADSPLPVLGDLSEENAGQFVTVFDEPYRKKRRSLPESAKPIVLGGTVYIRQVRLVQIEKKKLVLQWLATVQQGRMYAVELFCEIDPANPEDYATPLTDARDYAYAVAAHLSPTNPVGETATPPSAADSTETLPASRSDDTPVETTRPEKLPRHANAGVGVAAVSAYFTTPAVTPGQSSVRNGVNGSPSLL
jgi:hypothetical protein